MSYEIIALDIDGTLTTSEKKITDRTKTALLKAQQNGKKVILASGRHDFGIVPTAKELQLDRFGGYIMAFNGGKVVNAETGEILSSVNFPKEYIKPVCDCIGDANITAITYKNNTIIASSCVNQYTYVESKILNMPMKVVDNFSEYVDFDINKILLAGEPTEIDKLQNVMLEKFKGYIDVFKSCPFFLEVMPLGINKGASLSVLLKKLGYEREQLIACGDSYNDMTMIGYAGLGVCMENGEDEVKKISDVIADSNDDDGVAKIVEKYMMC
ncbi:MAG: Cof-type HAD-IIB family hydrolase [Lachnospiraceae bacterium]|nr:Cof-type HAD-IIB family hydrolase [Lachnospiraceae bacterium]